MYTSYIFITEKHPYSTTVRESEYCKLSHQYNAGSSATIGHGWGVYVLGGLQQLCSCSPSQLFISPIDSLAHLWICPVVLSNADFCQ